MVRDKLEAGDFLKADVEAQVKEMPNEDIV